MTAPTPRRRPRLSDAETEQRMLAAASHLLAERGVTVTLEGLVFEDVVRAAQVSRTSAYRRWPTRETFLDDVLVTLARGSEVPGAADRVVADGAEELSRNAALPSDPQARRALFVELLRLSVQADLETTAASKQFTAYLVVRAAVAGVTSDGLRERVVAALATSEARAVARGSTILSGAARLLGQRWVSPLPDDEPAVVAARGISATMTGFLIAALTDPGLITRTRQLDPFGTGRSAAWSVPALTLTGLVLAQVEPDPDAAQAGSPSLRDALLDLVRQGAEAAAAAG